MEKQNRIREEEEAAAKKAAEEARTPATYGEWQKLMGKPKRRPQSSFTTFDQRDPLGLMSRPEKGDGDDTQNRNNTLLIRSLYVDDIPEELAQLCLARNCIMCSVPLSSLAVARSHYLGKSHRKRSKVLASRHSYKCLGMLANIFAELVGRVESEDKHAPTANEEFDARWESKLLQLVQLGVFIR